MAGPVEVSIVVPAYNEATRLPATLAELTRHLADTHRAAEIIVVDDGSTDTTPAVLGALPATAIPIRTVRLPINRGKGWAVVAGVMESAGRSIAFLDADLPYSLANLDHALALVGPDGADVAIGARDLPASSFDPSYPLARRLAGHAYARLVRWVLGLPFGETQCGLKSFRADAARALFTRLTIPGYGFDVELVYLAWTRGYRVERFPVTLSHRHESRVRLLQDSIRMFGDLWRVRRNEARGVYGQAGRRYDPPS